MQNLDALRRAEVAAIQASVISNNIAIERARLENEYGKGNVWNTPELQETFEVIAFAAPFCEVKHRKHGTKGHVTFQHFPRFYFQFVPA